MMEISIRMTVRVVLSSQRTSHTYVLEAWMRKQCILLTSILHACAGCNENCTAEPYWAIEAAYCDITNATEICGDGHVVGVEFEMDRCDDGNTNNDDGCSAECAIECGWNCTGGHEEANDVCNTTCGDGLLAGPEECDDGDNFDNGCSAKCTIQPGWACYGSDCSTSWCFSVCGDGLRTGAELKPNACEDSNTDSGDGCSSTCMAECGYNCTGTSCQSVCGDGRKTKGEL
jgi:cysteine-rich repeat protein